MDAAAALFVQPEQMSRVGSSVAIRRNNADKGQYSQQQQQMQQAPAAQLNANDINEVIAQIQNEFINYKFTVYRCACKFVKLQKILHTSKIPYQLVLAILERHGMDACIAQDKLMVPPYQFTTLLHDIYYAGEKLGYFNESQGFQLEKATALLANFFWNTFDPHRRHSISLLEIKVTFLLLSKLFNNDTLVSEFFDLFVNINNKCVSKFSFENMVKILSKVLTSIGEEKAYGPHNLKKVMKQCFARCHNSSGLTEYQFHSLWNSAQTRLLVYTNLLALIKRIEETEHLIHKNSCIGCHRESIIGIRFKCQSCKDLSLCLNCFACGYSSNKHVPTHRMFEIFLEDKPPKKWTHYFGRLCCFYKYGLRSQQQREEMKSFCNLQNSDVGGGDSGCNAANESHIVAISNAAAAAVANRQINSTKDTYVVAGPSSIPRSASEITQSRRQSSENQHDLMSLAGLTSTATNASSRLQSIIDSLILQNINLEMQISNIPTASHEEISTFLNIHHKFLVRIINEMRSLSNCSTATSTFLTALSASTPRFSQQRLINQNQPLGLLYDPNGGGDFLSHSINGADLNRSYLEANKSDYSLKDLSTWFDPKKSTSETIQSRASCPPQMLRRRINTMTATDCGLDGRDTEMKNFKLLLHKVKEIIDDSYSDNAVLSAATQNLEYALDSMIKDEEIRRRST